VTGALKPGVAQHPAEMLLARLDHAAARVGMTRSLSLVGGGAKPVPDQFHRRPRQPGRLRKGYRG
jgi:hypothetical protein